MQRFVVRYLYVLVFAVVMATPADVTFAQDDGQADPITVLFSPRRKAILSASVSMKVIKLAKEFAGEAFKKGDLLIELDSEIFKEQLEKEKALSDLSDENLKGAKEAHDKKLTLRQAQAGYNLAKASMDGAEASKRNQTHIEIAKAALKVAATSFENARQSKQVGDIAPLDFAGVERDYIIARESMEMARAKQETEYAQAKQAFVQAEARLSLAPYQMESDFFAVKRDAAKARADYLRAKKAYDACFVRAPFNGRVKKIFVHEHETVKEGMPLMEVVDDSELIASFMLKSSYFKKISVGQKIRIHVEETGNIVTGVIKSYGATIHGASRTFYVDALVDNAANELRAGMHGKVALSEVTGE